MTSKRSTSIAVFVGLGLALILISISVWASGNQATKSPARTAVLKIADLLEKGKMDAARREAVAAAGKVNAHDVMSLLKMRSDEVKGFGVGDYPEKITPDGIEKQIEVIGRDGITQEALNKNSTALAKMGYRVAAVAEISMAMKYPKKEVGKKTRREWVRMTTENRALALELAKAIERKDPAAVKLAASQVTTSCGAAHSLFREE